MFSFFFQEKFKIIKRYFSLARQLKRFFLLAGLISPLFLISHILNLNFIAAIFICALLLYIKYRDFDGKEDIFLYALFLFVINFAVSFYIIEAGLPIYYIPFAMIPMCASILFNKLEVVLLLVLASAVSLAALAGNNLAVATVYVICGIVSACLVSSARRRMSIIHTGFIVGLLQVVLLYCLDSYKFHLPVRYIYFFFNGVISSIAVVGILPVFEYLFRTVTNISLLELADFNQPLLQRLVLEAPGTYHHSLIVGNLADAAAKAVGANGLLARIGAYYHDIGKLGKPQYFSENQNFDESKHDSLSPTMSKLVIINHVKEGVELANRHRLNPRLIAIIQQHHGNSLVYYFWRRALEDGEAGFDVEEEGFRYPGPKPDTKEAAIVLLADSVEAATRTIALPMPAKIEEVVRKIINNKFIDGQLDQCELALKDLERISTVFLRILNGIYHSRVNYTEGPKSEINHKKSAKETSHQPGKDKKNHF